MFRKTLVKIQAFCSYAERYEQLGSFIFFLLLYLAIFAIVTLILI